MIRGTSHEQDSRFADKSKKMLEKSVWPDEYDQRVNLKKVDFELIKLWIEQKVRQLLGHEDDIASNTAISLLEQEMETLNGPDPRKIHISLSGLLGEKNSRFMIELWRVLLEAQLAPNGIPESLLENKKKQEQAKRQELRELEAKRDHLRTNKNYLDRMVKSTTDRNRRQDRNDRVKRERSRSRSRSREHERNRNRDRDRERNRDRDRSRDRNRNNDRREHSPKRRHEPRHRDSSPKPKKKVHRLRANSSQSSSVMSSSSSSSSQSQ